MTQLEIAEEIVKKADSLDAVLCILEPSVRVDYPNRLLYLDDLESDACRSGEVSAALFYGRDLMAIQEDKKRDRSWFRCWRVTSQGEFMEQAWNGGKR